jgi:dienelactone hydrolase
MAGGATGQNGPAPTAGQPTIKTVVYKEANGIKRAMEMYNREALEKVGSMTEVKQQAMDIYFPPNWNPEKKVPGLLMFHGGGWSGGSRHQLRNVCDYFARRGLVAITADYAMHTGESNQLLPRNISRKRICVTDAKSAIRWVKTHADELGIDPDRLITGGVSAGGHIAVLAHLNSEGLNDPTDLGKIGTDAVAHMLISAAFFVPGRDRDDEVDAFAHDLKNMPPTLFLDGEKDGWKHASDMLFTKMHELGIQSEKWVAPDDGHNSPLTRPWLSQSLVKADQFLVELGLLEGEAIIEPLADKGIIFSQEP